MRKVLVVLICTLCTCCAFAACAPTPVAAAQAAFVADLSPLSGKGFRATEATFDVATHRIWVRVVACNDPARPAVLVPFSLPVMTASASLPQESGKPTISTRKTIAVRAGESLSLHFAAGNSRVDLQGTAEEQGYVGQLIRVRIASTLAGQTTPRHLKATLIAPGEAELQP